MRRENGTARRAIPTLHFSVGAVAPFAPAARSLVTQGRGGSPSGLKFQAHSAVIRKKCAKFIKFFRLCFVGDFLFAMMTLAKMPVLFGSK
jgi:hypothetical protein